MKVVINEVVYDANVIPITVVFKNDQERKSVALDITNMPPRRSKRAYYMGPTKFRDSAYDIMENAVKLTHKKRR